LKVFIGLICDKKPVLAASACSVLCFLNMRSRKGLKSPSEITENKLERILQVK
jgi:hypothetical protein